MAPTTIENLAVPQSWQADAAVEPSAVLYVPALQSLQALAASCPSTLLYLPLPQLVHVLELCAAAVLYVPLSQAVHPTVPALTPWPTVDDHRPAIQFLQDDAAPCWV
jgi:hypothetical protein